MRKTVFVALLCAIGIPIAAFSAWQSGLYGGAVMHVGANAGVNIDKTQSPLWTNVYEGPFAAQETGENGTAATADCPPVWCNARTWVFWGQMYFDGSDYFFMKHIDDAWMLKIDGVVYKEDAVNDEGAWGRVDITDAIRPAKGWHDIELRFGNGGGGSGRVSMDDPGFGVLKGTRSDKASDYVYPSDPGDMSVFRYDDGLGFDDALFISSSLGKKGEFGSPVPPYGVKGNLTEGASFTCSMSPTSGTSNGTDYQLVGYSLYWVDAASGMPADEPYETGTESTLTYTHGTSQAQLVWNWTITGYHLTAASANTKRGTVSLSEGVYEPGTVAEVKALPKSGFQFYKWSGNIPDSEKKKETLSITMTQPVTLEALFVPAGDNCYYVSPSGNDETNDGLSWKTAFATPEVALQGICDGDRIVLDAGRYVVDSALVITNAIVFEGDPERGEAVITRELNDAAVANLLVLANPEAVVRGLVFDGNRAKFENQWYFSWLSAVKIEKEGGTVEKCVIRNSRTNNNSTQGGGVDMYGGILRDCIITNNMVLSSAGDGRRGGGLSVSGGIAERCFIHANESNEGQGSKGGGASVTGDGILRNSLITGNIARWNGSGVYMDGGILENCTIADNHHALSSETADCAGLFVGGGKVRNCIVAGNWNTGGTLNIRTATFENWHADVEHCCSDSFPATVKGTGNIVADPQFVDASNGDYHLSSGLCINAGTNQAWMTENAVDYEGNPRVSDDIVDIGCYEFKPSKLVCSFDVSKGKGLDAIEVVFVAHVAGTNLQDLVYTWDFGDSNTLQGGADLAVVTNLYNTIGSYTVKLTVANNSGKAEAVRENCVTVVPSTLYVDVNNTMPMAPYATPETAANNVKEAVDVALDGATVVVADGVYTFSTPISLTKRIALRSENGPKNTTLKIINPEDPSGVIPPALNAVYAGVPGVVLEGFTVTGAGHSALCFTKGGTIENCIVRDNKTLNLSGEGAGINMDAQGEKNGGIIRNCLVFNNYCTCSGGVGYRGGGIHALNGVLIDSCTVVSNFVGDGGESRGGGIYAENSSIRNCLIARNGTRHNSAGVHMVGGTIENCTIVQNYCLSSGVESNSDCRFASGISLEYILGTWAASAVARNLIIWGNTFSDGFVREAYSRGEPTENLYYSCLMSHPESVHGEGNFSADPGFMNSEKGDFHLRTDSPCKNAGLPLDWMVPGATDLDGARRVFEKKPDLGCYENNIFTAMILMMR